ncbi:hypothetical protein, partial [Helicobacter bilis]|uniref:hypothetical protein n=1 Tax=Helicobacter bilis TaxID=37372 RepID=UPI0018841E73
YQHYLKYNMLEQANQCKINIEQMQCFIADTTLFDLQQELSKKYKYYFDGSDEFKAWRDTELDKTKANDKDFMRHYEKNLMITSHFLDNALGINLNKKLKTSSYENKERVINEI